MKKKKIPWAQILMMAAMLLMGGAFGWLLADQAFSVAESADDALVMQIILFAGIYLVIWLQLVLHEAGHLVFGLATGYGFCSFRIGSIMWMKKDGRLCAKRYSLAGTGGQCLMTPPACANGDFPVMLYNLGGSLMNLLTGAVCFALRYAVGTESVAGTLLLISAAVGLLFALMNGVPVKGLVNNDGSNAVALRKDAAARKAFWLQLKVNELMSEGKRLKDMPEEWFAVPDEMNDSLTAAIGALVCNRLMDEMRLDEACTLLEKLVHGKNGLMGLQRQLLQADLLYCEAVGENRPEVIEQLRTKELKKILKAMRKYPAVLRTEYAAALLADKDASAAEKLRGIFEKQAAKYPYDGEIISERMLIEYAANRADS